VQGLLKHFGSVARLRAASHEELSAAPGLGPKLAEQVLAHLGHDPEAAAKLEAAAESMPDGEDRE
jgi:excinuclease ABC subunit C